MFRTQSNDAIHIPVPDLEPLFGQPGNQIQVDVVEAETTKHFEIFVHRNGPVDSPGALQVLVFQGLSPQTDPIDSDFTIPLRAFQRRSFRDSLQWTLPGPILETDRVPAKAIPQK